MGAFLRHMLARALATHYLPTRLTATHLHVAVRSAAAAAAKTPPHTYTPALQPFSPPSTASAFPLTLLEANLSPQRPPFQAPVLRTLHSSPYSPAAHPFISHPENQPRRAMSSTGGGAAAAGGGGGSSRSTLTLRNFTKLCDKVRANTAVQLYVYTARGYIAAAKSIRHACVPPNSTKQRRVGRFQHARATALRVRQSFATLNTFYSFLFSKMDSLHRPPRTAASRLRCRAAQSKRKR